MGNLPDPVAIDTVFSAAVLSRSADIDSARQLLDFMASPQAGAAKRAQGMVPMSAA